MEFKVSRKDRYKSGIYKISNTIDGRVYYGSAERFAGRYNSHKYNLSSKTCKRANKHLFNFVKKYGIDKLIFEVEELVDIGNLFQKEQEYLDRLFAGPSNLRFNIARKAINIGYLNLEMPGEQGRRISAALKGKKKSEEYSVNFSLAKGRPIGKFSSDGALLESYPSNLFIGRAGFNDECVRRVCVGQRKSYLGFFWAFLTDENDNQISLDTIRTSFSKGEMRSERMVSLFSIDGQFLKTFPTCGDAAKFLNLKSHSVRAACHLRRPIKDKIVLFSDLFGKQDLSESNLTSALSPKRYAGYSAEGELIAQPESLNFFKEKRGLNISSIYRSANNGIQYEGLFWNFV